MTKPVTLTGMADPKQLPKEQAEKQKREAARCELMLTLRPEKQQLAHARCYDLLPKYSLSLPNVIKADLPV